MSKFKTPNSNPNRSNLAGSEFFDLSGLGDESNGEPPPPNGEELPLSTATNATNPPRTTKITAIVYHATQKDPQSSPIPERCPRGQKVQSPSFCADGRGMSAVWDSAGKRNAVTVLQIPQAQVIAHKLMEKNGYWANQIGIGYRAPRNLSKAMLGHFAVAQVPPKAKVAEFRVKDETGLLPLGIFHPFIQG